METISSAVQASAKSYQRARETTDSLVQGLNSSYFIPNKLYSFSEPEVREGIETIRELIEIRENQITELKEQLVSLEHQLEVGRLEHWVTWDKHQRDIATWA